MIVKFYTTKDANNVINKTLTNEITLDIILKEACNMSTPYFTLEFDQLPRYNYCYIPEWKRYYFVTHIETTANKLFRVFLKCDVLESYKQDLLQCKANIIQRSENYNKYIDDGAPVEIRKECDIYKSNYILDYDQNTTILSTVGR